MTTGKKPTVIQVNLRIPEDLHARLTREAKRAGRSLNEDMVQRLSDSLVLSEAERQKIDGLKLAQEAKRFYLATEGATGRVEEASATRWKGFKK